MIQQNALIRTAAGEKPHRLSLYLPSSREDGSPIQGFEETAESVAQLLCRRFGGATSYPATGYFLHSGGNIQREDVRVLEFYCCAAKLEREQHFIYDLARRLRVELSQRAIALAVDGSMLLVPPDGADGSPFPDTAGQGTREAMEP